MSGPGNFPKDMDFIVHEIRFHSYINALCFARSVGFSDSGLTKHFLLRSYTDLMTNISEPAYKLFVSSNFLKLKQEQCLVTKT